MSHTLSHMPTLTLHHLNQQMLRKNAYQQSGSLQSGTTRGDRCKPVACMSDLAPQGPALQRVKCLPSAMYD